MRRSLAILATGLLLALVAVMPVAASDADMCASGRDFGAMHAMEATSGMLGKDAHPGMHRGFASCRP